MVSASSILTWFRKFQNFFKLLHKKFSPWLPRKFSLNLFAAKQARTYFLILLCVVIHFFALNQNKSFAWSIKFPIERMTIFFTENSNILNVSDTKEFNFWWNGYKAKPIILGNWKPKSG